MSLAFFQLTPWVSGFIGTTFTRDPYATFAVFSFIWLTPVWIAQNRNAADNTQISAHLYVIISLILGMVTGIVVNWATNYPRLLDMRLFREPNEAVVRKYFNFPPGFHPRTWAPETAFLLFDILMIVIGYYYIQGNYEPGVSESASKAGGWILIGFGIAFFIATYLWMWLSHSLDPFNKRQDSKYIWPLAALICIQASYDQWSPEKWNGIVLLAFILVVWVLNYFYFGYVGFRSDLKRWFYFGAGYLKHKERGDNDPRVDRFSSHMEALGFILVVGIPHFLTATGFYIADASKAGSILSVMVTLSAISAFWMIVFAAWGLWNRHQIPPKYGHVDTEWIFLHPIDNTKNPHGMSWAEMIMNGKFDQKRTGHARAMEDRYTHSLDKPRDTPQADPLNRLPPTPQQDQAAEQEKQYAYLDTRVKSNNKSDKNILLTEFI